MGWSWDPITDQWNDGFKRLKTYTKKTGAASPPAGFRTDGFALGTWVSRQRRNKDTINPERIALLEKLKGWSWDPNTDKWTEGFELLKEYTAINGAATLKAKFKTKNGFSLGNWVMTQRTNRDSLSIDKIQLLESLNYWSWDALMDKWTNGFEILKAYTKENGHARPSYDFKTKEGIPLGTWVSTQRKNKDSLSTERIKLLESLKGWSWVALTDRWTEAFEKLKTYTVKTGAARPTTEYNSKDGFALGSWVGTQRSNKASLSTERMKLLESLKGWSWDPNTDKWTEGFEILKAYATDNGCVNCPKRYHINGFALGSWVGTQRTNKDSLTPERKGLLESLNGWSWDPIADQWHEGFAFAQSYAEKAGSANPTSTYKTNDGFPIGSWVSRQRNNKDTLTPERIALLETLKGWSWDPLTDQWNDGFERLKAYTKENGHARPSKGFKAQDGFPLGQWAGRQRTIKNSLTPDRIALLQSMKGWSWDAFTDKWNDGFERLKAYATKNDHARPPQGFKTLDGYKLGSWVSVQRKNKDKLPKERKRLLESLPGWKWSAYK